MKWLANLLVKKITRGRDLRLPAERTRIGMIEGWSSILGNLLLTAVKVVIGLSVGSVSLLADAAHTASDISSSAVVVIGFRISSKAPDKEHPFGHGRAEYLVGLVVAAMLVLVGGSFIISSFQRLLSGPAIRPSMAAVLVTIAAIACKELMYHFSIKLGQMIDSEALIADAWHHRSDTFTSVIVLIALVGNLFKFGMLDALFGLLVSGFVIYAGVDLARKSTSRLLGTEPAPETKKHIINSALSVDGVINAHDLMIHDYGTTKSISLHIEVDGHLSLSEAHDIAKTVENQIEECLLCSAVVHVDPRDPKPASPELLA
ncbi:MAG TPA: cation transporter [Firmicutes bacterium]|nr:cation transporter [Bacillota bacterium]